jgi:hypothetical protein
MRKRDFFGGQAEKPLLEGISGHYSLPARSNVVSATNSADPHSAFSECIDDPPPGTNKAVKLFGPTSVALASRLIVA